MSCALKICGVTRAEDVEACRAAGVEAIGLNFWRGSKRVVSRAQAERLSEAAHRPGDTPPLKVVGVFVDHAPHEVQQIAHAVQLDYVQPHGDVSPGPVAALGIPWIWVVRGTPDVTHLDPPSPPPSWVLLDAHVPNYGGEGTRTDWEWAATAVRMLAPTPVWLAGGITPSNALEAKTVVGAAGLDVASGAENPGVRDGRKDADRIARLARICHNRGS